jgi:hypothetical protein
MQTNQPLKLGGRRIGAGRPKETYKYGEPTVPVRVPVSLMKEVGNVAGLLSKARRKLPLIVVGKSTKPQ